MQPVTISGLVTVMSYENLKRIVSEYYDIGELISAEQLAKGYINVSYKIETLVNGERNLYLFRRYGKGSIKNKIMFEHALLIELRNRNFLLAPQVIETQYGKTYVRITEEETNLEFYVAIFTYLSGKDKYNWDNPSCTDQELANAAKVLALFHEAIYGWKCGQIYLEPRIVDQIPEMLIKWSKYVCSGAKSSFDIYFLEHYDYLKSFSMNLMNSLGVKLHDKLPEVAIHGDYHPGHLLFQDGKVTGVLDFDWSKIDVRCFDIGLAILYFCTAWEGNADGNLILDKVETFFGSYQQTWKKTRGLGPLNSDELQCVPEMILAGAFFVLDWAVNDYYTNKPDPEVYVIYLRHCVRLIKWLERNCNMLERCVYSYHQ